MRITRSAGTTDTERFLARLCDQCFLSLWSYPRPFNDRGGKNGASGQELCDLLIIFGNDVVIFSDKACRYPQGHDHILNWKRWYKKAVKKSADQVFGAERWLKEHPNRVFLDPGCSQRLPLPLPDRMRMQVHRAVVAIGSAQERNGRGLHVRPAVVGDAEAHTIGQVALGGGFVHVFDESSLWTVLAELSTTPDFIEYLRSKEAWIEAGGLATADSELDLLALYMNGARAFPSPTTPLAVPSLTWQRLAASPKQEAKRRAEQNSFFWDSLIEYFNRQYNAHTLEYGNEMSITEYEIAVRLMAGETRVSRRSLSDAIIERMHRAVGGWVPSVLLSYNPEVAYVLLVGPGTNETSYTEYRRLRTAQLRLRCHVAKLVYPGARWMIGLAIDAIGAVGGSEDLMLLDTNEWSESELAQARAIQNDLGYFLPNNVQVTDEQEWEYPQIGI